MEVCWWEMCDHQIEVSVLVLTGWLHDLCLFVRCGWNRFLNVASLVFAFNRLQQRTTQHLPFRLKWGSIIFCVTTVVSSDVLTISRPAAFWHCSGRYWQDLDVPGSNKILKFKYSSSLLQAEHALKMSSDKEQCFWNIKEAPLTVGPCPPNIDDSNHQETQELNLIFFSSLFLDNSTLSLVLKSPYKTNCDGSSPQCGCH